VELEKIEQKLSKTLFYKYIPKAFFLNIPLVFVFVKILRLTDQFWFKINNLINLRTGNKVQYYIKLLH